MHKVISKTTRTTCPYCGVGCGILATVDQNGSLSVQGDPEHPANRGRLCSKGAALAETVDHDGRLLRPMIDGRPSEWDAALDTVATRFRAITDNHGPDAVAFYVSGQLLTEDYYVANKLMKGFIGSGNIDTNSRLCMSSSVAGHKRAFGSDTVPCCYEDLELADLLVLVGSNAAWCHPVLFQRIRAAKQRRPEMKLVVVDPRRTATCDIADLHLPLAPGADVALFNGLLHYLERNDRVDWGYVVNHTEGFAETLEQARCNGDPVTVTAGACGLDSESVTRFFDWFAAAERTVSVYSQGVHQWSFGTDKVNAIINCHLATGRIGKPGMGPFSFTGQPNAMGGREVGGLANQLAAHMDFVPEDVERVQRFWNASRMAAKAGLKAVDLFDAVANGRIKAIWIMATNPAVSLPDSNRVRSALKACELVVVSDCVELTDTTACADILLPAATWGEKDGTVTNTERCISRQRAFLPPAGESKPDWWILSQVARRMGFDGFGFSDPWEIFREHALLSGFENGGARDFDISVLAPKDQSVYDALQPVQWPVTVESPSGTVRLLSPGRYFTPSGRARFVPVTTGSPGVAPDREYPLVLNTGRVRDHWHSMTRTGKSPRLSGHDPEPFVELNPQDAAEHQLPDGGLVRLRSRWGEALLRTRVTAAQQSGSLFVPMHWNDCYAGAGRACALVNPVVDPISGQPELKHTPVQILAYRPTWYGFVFAREELGLAAVGYWSKARRHGMWHYEIAGEEVPDGWASYARNLLAGDGSEAQWIEMLDSAHMHYRAARIVDGRLTALLFIGPDHQLPPRDWLARLFAKDSLDAMERARVLAGTPGKGEEDSGPVICSCFDVGRNTLCKAVAEQGLITPEAIGKSLQAGTNCGSCVPEIRQLIAEAQRSDAA